MTISTDPICPSCSTVARGESETCTQCGASLRAAREQVAKEVELAQRLLARQPMTPEEQARMDTLFRRLRRV